MNNYPIEGLMNTAMNSIKEMVDVNTIIGEPIETSNNVVIIPVSKVNFGLQLVEASLKFQLIMTKISQKTMILNPHLLKIQDCLLVEDQVLE